MKGEGLYWLIGKVRQMLALVPEQESALTPLPDSSRNTPPSHTRCYEDWSKTSSKQLPRNPGFWTRRPVGTLKCLVSLKAFIWVDLGRGTKGERELGMLVEHWLQISVPNREEAGLESHNARRHPSKKDVGRTWDSSSRKEESRHFICRGRDFTLCL